MGFFGKKEEPSTYLYTNECENCENMEDFDIPIGTRVKEFKKGKICENCGCQI